MTGQPLVPKEEADPSPGEHASANDASAKAFTLGAYLKDHAAVLGVGVLSLVVLAFMLAILRVTPAGRFICCLVLLLMGCLALTWDFGRKRSYYQKLGVLTPEMEQGYYLSSLLERPNFLEGQLGYDACQAICQADAAQLDVVKAKLAQAQEISEMWTHEAKTPIAALRLMVNRMHGPDALALRRELDRLELACQRSLFGARMGNISTDYLIAPTKLLPLCQNSCKSLASLLIEAGVTPSLHVDGELAVLTDGSWVGFVLQQVISNSVKYQARHIAFSAWEENPGTPQGHTILEIADDGCGIPAHELGRVFDKGFSGSNGKAEGSSTGMGLHLSYRACQAMGLMLQIASDPQGGTTVRIVFPHDRTEAKLTAR